MNTELITLYRRVHVAGSSEPHVPTLHVLGLNKEVAMFGYTFDRDMIERVATLLPAQFETFREDLHKQLAEISGARANHQTLFAKFPYEFPEQTEYLFRRIIGFLQNEFGLQTNQCTMLSCGHVVDHTLFDLSEFGACPICQFQVDELLGRDEVKYPFERVTPLKILSPADNGFVQTEANTLLARNGSLSKAERKFLEAARNTVSLTVPSRVYRENLPYCYSLFDDPTKMFSLLSGATDVLRIASYLSNPEADLSLAENTKFKLNKRQKWHMFVMLEHFSSERLAEDMMRHRERWLRFGELRNPTSKKSRAHYPRVAAAFDVLRNAEKDIPTFNRTVERTLRAGTVTTDLLRTMRSRPGEFMRRLDWMLRTSPVHRGMICEEMRVLLPSVDLKMAFAVKKAFEFRRLNRSTRYFFPKGQTNKIQIVEDKRKPLDSTVLDDLGSTFTDHLIHRLEGLGPMGRVFLDPGLQNLVLPFNVRGDSLTNTAVSKGSRYPVDGEVIRLFVHWTGEIDVDLSVAFYDENFKDAGHVGFTNLSYAREGRNTAAVVHSGDIQNAPDGASEFIDVSIAKLLKVGVRYVVPTLISYRGEPFTDFPCFAGFMERDGVASGRKYEPESVKWKFDVSYPNTSATPLVFDLQAREVIFADLASGKSRYGATARNMTKYAGQAKAVLDMIYSKPTVFDVLYAHVMARGSWANDPGLADMIFTPETVSMADIMSTYVDIPIKLR
jgi:hypothetical protein